MSTLDSYKRVKRDEERQKKRQIELEKVIADED